MEEKIKTNKNKPLSEKQDVERTVCMKIEMGQRLDTCNPCSRYNPLSSDNNCVRQLEQWKPFHLYIIMMKQKRKIKTQ